MRARGRYTVRALSVYTDNRVWCAEEARKDLLKLSKDRGWLTLSELDELRKSIEIVKKGTP